jgi:hypothetical protein
MHSYHRPRRIQYALSLCFVAFGGLVNAQGPVPNVSLSIRSPRDPYAYESTGMNISSRVLNAPLI